MVSNSTSGQMLEGLKAGIAHTYSQQCYSQYQKVEAPQ